jgi:uncharacterized protein HemX
VARQLAEEKAQREQAATQQAEVARQLAEEKARREQTARRGYALAAVFALIALLAAGVFGFLQTQAKLEAARERDGAEQRLLEARLLALVSWQSCRRIERVQGMPRPACSWRSRRCQPTGQISGS